MVETRRSSRRSDASESSYRASEPADEEEQPSPKVEEEVVLTTTSRGRRIKKAVYVESSEYEEEEFRPSAANLFDDDVEGKPARRGKRASVETEDSQSQPRRSLRNRKSRDLAGFIASEDEFADEDDDEEHGQRRRLRRRPPPPKKPDPPPKPVGRQTRNSRRAAKDDDYQEEEEASSQADAEGSSDDEMQLVSEDINDLGNPRTPTPEPEDDNDGKPYAFRQRAKINYAIPPPIEEMKKPPPKHGRNGYRGGKKKGLGWSASGAELARWMGGHNPHDDSDSDHPTRTPRKQPFGAGLNPFGSNAIPAGGILPGDLVAGTPSNLGKIGDAALADADPLGVNTNVTFDEVGGLDEHIHSLKEMTLLPLLYPEVFQRFSVTPPRGVLFHGPPGTGKTLLARALAASCRSDGRQISFFMRKGADCLSKWVGEAERQLRLLFEEARNSQPSIIFFDEIDGLAPVRSSKQDQIHASIVSTLLALMDGMDGRGQVIVIGATNRPDAVDPALRRPGRFDREFYFGLPGLEAREKILGIMTRKWAGWDTNQEGEKGERVKETLKGLAKLTKGYGGADLRALCTEAALNAIQRRYPQVYKSNDRLLLQPETIDVGLRDFMISIKKIVPSSARSATSAATNLPPQFEALLSGPLQRVKDAIQRVMPIEKKLTALEEAEFEDEGGEDGALEREMLSQSMQTLRIYRPRVIIHGPVGMGQGYIGAAALHHLEGYHIQSLELGSLMSDSTRTVEAAIVQLFTEAKRHQPSVIYIPSLIGWCAAVNETTRSTVRAMLETLLPTDPILLLAVVDGPFSALPKDVKQWFGASKENRVALEAPSADQREAFFEPMIKDIQRPPNQFADGMKRRKRILEVLPIAPPLEPRKPTAAELAVQRENDQKTIVILKFRLGPILSELKRKFKRFTKRATEEYNFEPDENGIGYVYQQVDVTAGAPATPNGTATIDLTNDAMDTQPDGTAPEQQQATQQAMLQSPILYDMDLDKMHSELYKGRYLTPQHFLEDVRRIVHNAEVFQNEDSDRFHKAQAMFTMAELSLMEFDGAFRLECERMAQREMQRRQEEEAKEKEREKEKNKTAANTQANGIQTRRSTRQNGTVDLLMTDPVKLERKLKRQRDSAAANADGVDGHTSGSAEEHGSGQEPRNAKRSRVVPDEEDDDQDPMNIVSPSDRVGPGHVRFANSVPQIQAPGGGGMFGAGGVQASPSPMNYHHPNQMHQQRSPMNHGHGQHSFVQQPQPPHYGAQGGSMGPQSSYGPPQMHGLAQPQFGQPMDQMGGMSQGHGYGLMGQGNTPQRRMDGFDPSLLNPVQPVDQHHNQFGQPQFQQPQQSHQLPYGGTHLPHSPHHQQVGSPFGVGPSQGYNQPAQQFGGVNPSGGMGYSNERQLPPFHQQQHQHQQHQHQLPQHSVSPPAMYDDPQNPLYTPASAVMHRHPPMVQPLDGRQGTPGHEQLQLPVPQQRLSESRSPEPGVRPPSTQVTETPEVEQRVEGEEVRKSPQGGDNQEQQQQQDQDQQQQPAGEPMAVVVERSPTPPHPEFHVSETLLEKLRRKLREETEGLNVEQLEQLRATCLGDVWRHRKEWDRDGLVRVLFKVVDDFLEEVKEMGEWDEE
ncbi:ATPase with bromodomain-containing protein [Coprinopsis cinerea okayama7|uniref:ATPase with bromodomain-containing protein n=1 Tax=Coprinopsis cinerea (strain Okayama-7 / 130 / ATCC MYA-4618 / FGSC 9003) TaxID=240176 RepID=A8P7N0_COPC7|nr:ATPase with bromodomain-containing protein [Coprinopsis cinerea okayama7\|eukprot:XP_001839395.1 ATPase with bromodomain-containing protein [Coprinopsis cinerea okayama7\